MGLDSLFCKALFLTAHHAVRPCTNDVAPTDETPRICDAGRCVGLDIFAPASQRHHVGFNSEPIIGSNPVRMR